MKFIRDIDYTATENPEMVKKVEGNIINYAENLYKGRYRLNEFGAHEITDCLRRSFVSRKFYSDIDSIKSAYHFTFGNLFENIIMRVLERSAGVSLEREEAIAGKKYDEFRLIGHNDFYDKSKVKIGDKYITYGIIELKTIKRFVWLPKWNIGFTPLVKYQMSKEWWTESKGPQYGHLDRLLTYLVIPSHSRSSGTLLYISKIKNQGIVPFTIYLTDEGKKEVKKRLDYIATEYSKWLDYFLDDPRKLEDMIEDINEIPAMPNTWCSSCRFGGYSKGSGGRYIKKPDGTSYPNYCKTCRPGSNRNVNAIRKYQRSVYDETSWLKNPKWNPDKPTEYPLNESDGVIVKYLPEVQHDLENKIISTYTKLYVEKNSFRDLFTCPRKVHLFNIFGANKIASNNDWAKNIIIWMWKQSAISSELMAVYDKNYREDDIIFEHNNIIYSDEIFYIFGNPTIIIPTAIIDPKWEANIKGFPRDRDVNRAIFYLATSEEEKVYLIYHGIRTTNMLIFDISVKRSGIFIELNANIKERLNKIEKNIPEPEIHCLWCPLVNYKDSSGNYICKEGRIWAIQNEKRIPLIIKKIQNREPISPKILQYEPIIELISDIINNDNDKISF